MLNKTPVIIYEILQFPFSGISPSCGKIFNVIFTEISYQISLNNMSGYLSYTKLSVKVRLKCSGNTDAVEIQIKIKRLKLTLCYSFHAGKII